MHDSTIEQTILSTFIYYEPLRARAFTPLELLRYWTPTPEHRKNDAFVRPVLSLVLNALHRLEKIGALTQTNGYYALASAPSNAFSLRIHGRKVSSEKRRIFRAVARFFPYIPYVRMVALTGSVARDNATNGSDIDVLVASTSQHIWLTRLLVGVLTFLLGKYRNQTRVRDRICLNHYISHPAQPTIYDSCLEPAILSTAQIYAAAMPHWNAQAFEQIGRTNQWMYTFIPTLATKRVLASPFHPSSLFLSIKNIVERLGDWSGAGKFLENIAQTVQKTRILRAVGAKQILPIEMIISDTTLLFHYPFSRSKSLEKHYYAHVGTVDNSLLMRVD